MRWKCQASLGCSRWRKSPEQKSPMEQSYSNTMFQCERRRMSQKVKTLIGDHPVFINAVKGSMIALEVRRLWHKIIEGHFVFPFARGKTKPYHNMCVNMRQNISQYASTLVQRCSWTNRRNFSCSREFLKNEIPKCCVNQCGKLSTITIPYTIRPPRSRNKVNQYNQPYKQQSVWMTHHRQFIPSESTQIPLGLSYYNFSPRSFIRFNRPTN